MRRWLLAIIFCGSAAQAQFVFTKIESPCDAFRSSAFQDQHYDIRIRNCEKLVRSGAVPNTKALNYTLKYLAQNYKGLKDSRCAMEGLDKDYPCRICKNPARVRQGIQNGCSFILNDLNKKWGDGTTRVTGYYVDLCQPSDEPLVEKFYVNIGTGTIKNKHFVDIPDMKTTVPGAFLTDDRVVKFDPFNPEPYQELATRFGGEIPGIRLVGLNSSNNSSEDSKPMHVSPFQTSSGCPSVGPESAPIMRKFVQNGPALLMNYHSEKYEQKSSCENEASHSGSSRTNNGATNGGVQ